MSTSNPPAYLEEPTQHWIETLKSEDALMRRLASYALGMIGPSGGPASVSALDRAIDDPEPFVRVWAAAALARVKPDSDRVAPALASAMASDPAFLRSLGAWHVGRIGCGMPGSDSALGRLEALRHDADPSVRSEAELSLKRLRGRELKHRC